MNKVKFDFNHIADLPAFYRQFSHEFSLIANLVTI